MAFPRRVAPTPAKVGRVTVTLSQELDAAGELLPVEAAVEFVPVTATGERIGDEVRVYQLWEQLTAQQKTGIESLLGNLRTRGDAEAI